MADTEEVIDLGNVGYEPSDNGSEDAGFRETAPDDGNIYTGDDGDGDDSPKEKRPERHEPRTPAADLISLVWGGIGTALVQTGTDVPVGRVLALQAPLAGKRFDALLAGTWLDKWIQPVAKQGEALEGLGSLIMLPLLVGAYERNPALGPVLESLLRAALESNLAEMVPVLRERKNKERSHARALRDLSDVLDFEVPKGADAIEVILASIFAGLGPEPEAEPQP